MRLKRGAGVLLLVGMLGLAGCEDNDHTVSRDVSGQWTLTAGSRDGRIRFRDTSLLIGPGVSGYALAWMSPAPNGTLILDTNTMAVTMSISASPAHLVLTGTVVSPDRMGGGGAIDVGGEALVAEWEARR